MARKVDITDKLSFEGNPSLVIKGKAIEVNADAPTMLKVMGLMSANDPGAQEILEAYDMMFPEKSKKEIERMKLGFNDLIIVVQEAVQLISGNPHRPDIISSLFHTLAEPPSQVQNVEQCHFSHCGRVSSRHISHTDACIGSGR